MTDRIIPKHVAIIMDGNGRWAKERRLPRNEGHRRGTKALENIISHAEKIGVEHLTVYAFSTENWKRPKEEVDGLMKLFDRYLDQYIKRAEKEKSKYHIIGDLESPLIPESIKKKMALLEEKTKNHPGMCFHMAFNYGGRDELTRAFKKIGKQIAEGKLAPEAINEETIANHLDTAGIPDPDLMIRTSGEERTSNFLPWQLTYTEFYFTPCLWPDFGVKEFEEAIDKFSMRNRRFGKSE